MAGLPLGLQREELGIDTRQLAHPTAASLLRLNPRAKSFVCNDMTKTISAPISRILLAAVLGLAALALLGWFSSADRAGAAAVKTVNVKNFRFRPKTLSVTAGTTVTFTNKDTTKHTATLAGTFNTHGIKPGKSKSVTFNTAGTFSYTCSIHPTMHGTIVVQ